MFRSIGREAELAEVCQAVDELEAVGGRPLLVAGEAGIGKTLLIEDVGRYASGAGFQVAITRCPNGEGGPPYWPWSELLRACVRRYGPDLISRQPDLVRADAARLLPAGPVQAAASQLPSEDDRSRFEFFHNLVTVFQEAGRQAPLLLVLDDLHWADTSTLRFYEFLARSLISAPVLLVATYRDVEITSDHPLVEVVTGLPGSTIRIDLRGVAGDDLARLMAETGGFNPSDSLVRWAQAHTAGNPLFVKEVVRLLKFERRLDKPPDDLVLPLGVQGTIERRLGGLHPETLEVLRWAAVCGDEFSVALLKQASGSSDDAVSRALGTACRIRLASFVSDRPGYCAFTHGLVAQTLREGLLPDDRSKRHLRLAEVHITNDRGQGQLIPETSQHLLAALPDGDPGLAATYAARAASEASRKLAWEEAARLYGAAIDALSLTGEDKVWRAELMAERATVLNFTGGQRASEEAALAAGEAARLIGDSALIARSALHLSGSPFVGGLEGGDARIIDLLSHAIDATRHEDSAARAVLLARLAREHYFIEPTRFQRLSQEAFALAVETGDPVATGEGLFQRYLMLTCTPDLEERLATSSELVRLGEQMRDWVRSQIARIWHVVDLATAGDGQALTREVKAFAGSLEYTHVDSLRWFSPLWENARALADGRLSDAENSIIAALGDAETLCVHGPMEHFGMQYNALRKQQGRLTEIEPLIAGAVERFPALPGYRCALAYIHGELGDLTKAEAQLERLAIDNFAAIPRDVGWVTSSAFIAAACVSINDPVLGRAIYSQMLPYAEHHIVPGLGALYLGPVARLLGCLAGLWHDWGAADEHFRSALSAAQRFEAPLAVAQTKLDWATMLIRRGQPGDADRSRQLLDDARTFADHAQIPLLQRMLADIATPRTHPAATPTDANVNVFRKEADYWTIVYEGECVLLRDLKGLHDIADLIASPNHDIHVIDLEANRGAARPSLGADPAIDVTARNDCKRRLQDLEDEIDEAERLGDSGRAARARDEQEAIASYLAGAYGLGQRSRRPGDSTEQARKTVWHRINTSLMVIEKEHPALFRHLQWSIRTGTFCSYSPEKPVNWSG